MSGKQVYELAISIAFLTMGAGFILLLLPADIINSHAKPIAITLFATMFVVLVLLGVAFALLDKGK